ncbi:MAG: peptidase M61 [Pseudomonadota bacterium]
MHFACLIFLLLTASSLLTAQPAMAQQGNSKPTEAVYPDRIAVAEDKPFPGSMALKVDASDVERGIFKVEQTISVPQSGRFTLLYPEWLPGKHAPRGEIEKLAGLMFFAGDQKLRWERDPAYVYAFHVTVPEGVGEITARFQFTSATKPSQGRVVVTPKMMNLQWNSLSLYPAGYYVRNIPVTATVTWPDDWRAGTALRAERKRGDTVTYATVDYDTLVDSPVFAGEYFKRWKLSDRVWLNVAADAPEYLDADKEQIEAHRRLVAEAVHLFGSQQYDEYDFLLALTNEMGSIGLEHHRSSENGVDREYFTEWDKGVGRRGLLPHEMAHSWNGKYRRPAGIWTPDYRTTKRDNLLWVYEGQTQFWGYVLSARSGLYSKQDVLSALASIAATFDLRKGREWRPLIDTTHDPVVAARKPKPWTSWQRTEAYYNEGMLIWLEADGIIRRESGGAKSLQDFARVFFGGRDGDWGVVTYDYDDVINTLQQVQPYDWDGFFQPRLYSTTSEAPKNGLTLGGYRLVYTQEQTPYLRDRERRARNADHSYSLGITVRSNGNISSVIWDSPAFYAGLTNAHRIVAVNEEDFSLDTLKASISATKDADAPPVTLLVKKGERYKTVTMDYRGGLRYPRLEKTSEGPAGLDLLLAPQVTAQE